MYSIEFMPKAWLDLGWFVKNDIKNIKKLYALLKKYDKYTFRWNRTTGTFKSKL